MQHGVTIPMVFHEFAICSIYGTFEIGWTAQSRFFTFVYSKHVTIKGMVYT